MTDSKKLLDDVLKVAKASAEELVDRGKAVASDIASRVGSDEAENAQNRADAAAARARADASKKAYEADMTQLDGQLNDALVKAKAQAAELVDRAKVEVSKVVDQAKGAVDRDAQEATEVPDTADQVGAVPPPKPAVPPTTPQSVQKPADQVKAQEEVDAGLYDK